MIRCFSEKYVQLRYSARPPSYKEAMESCVIPSENGDVCYDDEHEGWRKAQEISAAEAAISKDGGGFVGVAESARRVARGAVGLAKVSAGVGLADAETIQERLSICDGCEVSTPQDKHVEKRACGKLFKEGASPSCGCWLSKKTKVKSEKCPQGKW